MLLSTPFTNTASNVERGEASGSTRTVGALKATLLGLLSVIATIALAGCNREGNASATMSQARPPAAVSVTPVLTQNVPVYLDQIGKTVSVESVKIVPQIAGKIISRHVEDGAMVDKGQLLFEIDPRPFQALVDAAQAALSQNKAQLDLANIEFRRAQELISTHGVSQLEYDQKKSDVDVAQAKVQAAQADLETAQLNLDYTKIVSPIDGRASAVWIDPGNVVKANEGQLMSIQKLDPIYAEFTVTENDLGTVRKFLAAAGINRGLEPQNGLKVLVDVPGDSQTVLAALGKPAPATQPGKYRLGPREGTLTFLDNTVDPGSGTVKLRATLPNADHYFWPGQFVNARVILSVKENALLVPTLAMQLGQQGTFVYVAQQGEYKDASGASKTGLIAVVKPITAGQPQGDLTVVEKGLDPNDQVITSGQLLVQPGGPVQISGGAPAAAPATTQPSEATASSGA